MLPEFLQNSRLKVWAQRMSGGGRSKPAKKPVPRTPASPRRAPSAPAAGSSAAPARVSERPSNYRSVRHHRQPAAAAGAAASTAAAGIQHAMKPTQRQTINLNRARVSVPPVQSYISLRPPLFWPCSVRGRGDLPRVAALSERTTHTQRGHCGRAAARAGWGVSRQGHSVVSVISGSAQWIRLVLESVSRAIADVADDACLRVTDFIYGSPNGPSMVVRRS